MMYAEMLQSATDFIHQAILDKRSGAIAVAQANNQENRYFQIFTVGDSNDIATGELQIQIIGPKNAKPSKNQIKNFQKLLQNGWKDNEGNGEKITKPLLQRSNVEDVVKMLAKHLIEIYELDEACNWDAELFFC